VEHALRSSSLLRLEASRVRISQSCLKPDGGVVRMVHIASSWRSCGVEAEDGWVNAIGCIGLFYPNFAVFAVLGHRVILVFWFSL
jgi:hypothetical protein